MSLLLAWLSLPCEERSTGERRWQDASVLLDASGISDNARQLGVEIVEVITQNDKAGQEET